MSGALVLGVGNLLWADEGFGVRCAEAFDQRYEVPDNLSVVDGGTQGLYLVDLLREYDPVVIFDAVDFDDAPGSRRLVLNDDIPAFVGARKMSLHQAGLQDVIDLVSEVRSRTGLLAAVPDLGALAKTGRVPRVIARFDDRFDIKPLIEIRDDGEAHTAGVALRSLSGRTWR